MISFARTGSKLVYRPPFGKRLQAAGFALALLAVLLAMWPQLLVLSLPTPVVLLCGALWLALMVGCLWLALSLRTAFVFGVDGVAARGVLRTRTLAYEHIAGCTIEREELAKGRGPTLRGWRLAFEAMHPGIEPLRLFVADGVPLDPAIIKRLKTVPGLSSRQLKVIELAVSGRLEAA
jgi:hypothetical protein